MSGGFYPFPKHVWTPTGGWWFTPKNAKSNAVILTGSFLLTLAVAYQQSKKVEFDPVHEHDESVIDRWNNAVKK